MTKETETEAKASSKSKKTNTSGKINVIMGILNLLVIASIFLTAAVIYLGTDDLKTWALTVPAVIWAVIKLIVQFIK